MRTDSKFTPTAAALILHYIEQGTTLEFAAQRANVSRTTVWNWRQAGRRDGEGARFDFDLALTKKYADQVGFGENTLLALMAKDVPHAVRLSATKFFLKTRAPERYGDKETLVVQIRQETSLELLDYLEARLDSDTYDRVLSALAPTGSGPQAPPKQLNS